MKTKITLEDRIKMIKKGFDIESIEYKKYGLKPCPICNSKNLKICFASGGLYRVTCNICHCRVKGFMAAQNEESKNEAKNKAINLWNKRNIA